MYKEVNPAIFACVTFPFLFGVMFGDIAHGSLLLLVGIVLCIANSRLQGTSFEAAGQLRYMLLLMGLFATYMGFIYNEFFAIPLELFGSCYHVTPTTLIPYVVGDEHTPHARFPEAHYVRTSFDCVYTIGMDPRWFQTSNLLAYQNSLKMKTSVILGVLQMSLGICMKGFNALYFGAYVDFFFEFIPQISLLLALFGWMDTLIIGKWLSHVNYDALEELPYMEIYSNPKNDTEGIAAKAFYDAYNHDLSGAPSVITTMINIFLAGADTGPASYTVIPGQKAISLILLLVAFISVPLMLCVKPCWLNRASARHADPHAVEHNPERSGS